MKVAGARVVVVGGERSGCAAAELLVSKGARVVVMDRAGISPDRRARLEERDVTLAIGPHDPEVLRAADLVVLSPGVPPDQPPIEAARAAGVPVIGELELASRWLRGRVVAITGTKGKSTTTTLVARMLEAQGHPVLAGGNLGTPLSSQVDLSTPETWHVVEVSSFQLETADTFHPWVSVLLNLSPDHLDRHASFDAYAQAKARIFRLQTSDDWAVVNADDIAALNLAADVPSKRFDFALQASLDMGVTIDHDVVVERRHARARSLFPVSAVRVPGRHLLADVLAASAVACLAGVGPESITAAVEGFTGLEHTLEFVVAAGDVRFVNDSKATNVVAARRSIESFPGGVVAIMGGRYKGGEFGDLIEAVRERTTGIVAIGEARERIAQALGAAVPVVAAASMREAVRRAYGMAAPGGVVLLAPGCSSFDMFTDYSDRGRAFKNESQLLVAELAAAERPM